MRIVPRFAVTAAVALALLLGVSARAQVLQAVPSESVIVVKVNNLQGVSAKVAALSQQWGLANVRPELNDPLGTLLTVANLGPGLDKGGEAALALLDFGGRGGRDVPKMVILVPVTDFKTFAASLPNAKEDGGVTTFSMGGSPEPGYVAAWGKYAAIAPKKEILANKGAGLQAPGLTAKELASKDVVVYANMKLIRNQFLPMFQQNKGEMLNMIERQMANAPNANPKYAPVLKAYIGQIFGVAEGFLRDTDGATFGIALSNDGIATTLAVEFSPGSYMGTALKGSKNTDASFTAGLPDGKYFLVGGMVFDKAGVQLLNDFVAPIEKELNGLGADGKPILTYLTAMKEYFAASKSSTFGLIAPPAAAIGQEGILQMINIVTGDSAKLVAAQKQMMSVQNEFMALTGGGGLGIKTDFKEAARTVDGVKLDEFSTTMNGQPQTPQEQQAVFLLQMLYGPKGMNAYSGVIGNDRMVMIAGVSEAMLTTAIKAAKENADPLGKGTVGKVAAALPKNRVAAFYVPIDTIATTVLDVMAARGMPGGVKLPPNLPPLGGTIATEGSALRFDGYVPAQTVQSLIAAGMQMWLQGMQGGGAGQPGGL